MWEVKTLFYTAAGWENTLQTGYTKTPVLSETNWYPTRLAYHSQISTKRVYPNNIGGNQNENTLLNFFSSIGVFYFEYFLM